MFLEDFQFATGYPAECLVKVVDKFLFDVEFGDSVLGQLKKIGEGLLMNLSFLERKALRHIQKVKEKPSGWTQASPSHVLACS